MQLLSQGRSTVEARKKLLEEQRENSKKNKRTQEKRQKDQIIKLIFILKLKKGKEKILQRQNSTKQIIIKNKPK